MKEDKHIYKSHNKSLLLYHFTCPAKYRRKIFTPKVEESLKSICIEIGERYEIYVHELGTDKDHVHFLVQSVPTYSPTKIITTLKSITARQLFKNHPEIKKQLWGGNLWTSGYHVSTVGYYGSFAMIQQYVKKQGQEYKQIYRSPQLSLFQDD